MVSSALAVAVASALWLGIQTSISPCPLATNIAAISYLGRRVGNWRLVLLGGLLYTLGRALAYAALGVLLVAGMRSLPEVSFFLQKYMMKLLGPLLVLTAMFLLDLLPSRRSGPVLSQPVQRQIAAMGIWGALILGVVFALSFCPFSAVLFFGNLVPIAIAAGSPVIVPSAYGLGTAIPVLGFALVIALSAQSIGRAFHRLVQIEWWARRVTGIVFLAIGVYFTLRFDFEVF